MPLTPFSQVPFGQQQNSRGFDPMTGKPQQRFQMPPPLQSGMSQLGGPFLSQQGQQSLAMGQMPTNEEQPQGGFEMPPPPGGPLTYQSPLGQTYQLDPNAAYTVGMGGKPKRAQMI